MANKNKNNSMVKSHSELFTKDVAPGVALGFVQTLFGLHDLLESITPTGDGVIKKTTNITVFLRLYTDSASTANMCMCPLIVQTSGGSCGDIVNIGAREINTMLNLAVSDVFGYDRLTGWKVSKIVPGDGTLAGSLAAIETTIVIPQKILQLLNKEQETERLQELYFAYVGYVGQTNTWKQECFVSVDYTEQRKKIIIR